MLLLLGEALLILETNLGLYPIPIDGEVEINEEERVVVVDIEEDEKETVAAKEDTLPSSVAENSRQETGASQQVDWFRSGKS